MSLKIVKVKTYTNKTDRIDSRKCLNSEIKHGDRARKKANRKQGKDEIRKEVSYINQIKKH